MSRNTRPVMNPPGSEVLLEFGEDGALRSFAYLPNSLAVVCMFMDLPFVVQ